MIIKVADFYFRIISYSSATSAICQDFAIWDKKDVERIDMDILLTDEDIERENLISAENGIESSREMNESLAIYRKICGYALQRDAFFMHGAVIEYQGKGYMFTAMSGTGKTTHIMQWKKAFGDENVTVINGDKPIIRFVGGKAYAYGTPWNGKEHLGINGKVELSGICFLRRGAENSIRRITAEKAIPLLFSQIMITDSSDLAKQLELVDKLVEKVPLYLLECNISEEAARVSYEGMSNQSN